MITSGSSSLELKFEVSIHDAVVDYTSIQKVTVDLKENSHNLVVLDVAGIPASQITAYTDLPVSIRITVGTMWSYTFVGYIAYLETVSNNKDGLVNNSPFQTTRMHCLGTTYAMKSRRAVAYNNITLSSLARQLAEKYSMSVSVPANPYVFPRLTQVGKSDWEMLVSAADYLGYRVVSVANHLDIYDPFAALSRNSFKPIYAMYGNQGNLKAKPGQVLKFTSTVGAATPDATRSVDTIHALVDSNIVSLSKDDWTGYGKKVTSLFSDEVAENAFSVSQADAVLTGRSRKKLPITAYAEVVGDPSLVPGMVVDLQRYESGLDGLWIITEARHEMFRGSAMTTLCLARDTTDNDTPIQNHVVPPAPTPSPSIIKNRRWVSTNEFVHTY